MKVFARTTLVTFLLFFTTFPVFAADQDETILKTMEQTWIIAITNSDRVTLGKLLDDSYVETSPNGARRSKADLLLAPPPAPESTQTLVDISVRVNGDMALVFGINRLKLSPSAQPADYSFTDVFVRRPEGWRAISSQMTHRWGVANGAAAK